MKKVISLCLSLMLMFSATTAYAQALDLNDKEMQYDISEICSESERQIIETLKMVIPGYSDEGDARKSAEQTLDSFLEENQIALISEIDHRSNKEIIEKSFEEPVVIYEAEYTIQTRSTSMKTNTAEYLYEGDQMITCSGVATTDLVYHAPIEVDGNYYSAESRKLLSSGFGWTMSENMNQYDGVRSVEIHAVEINYNNLYNKIFEDSTTPTYADHHTSGSSSVTYSSAPYATLVFLPANTLGHVVVFFQPTLSFSRQSVVYNGYIFSVEWGENFL
ncbi:MAG: hypothetical protein EOM54_00105 [Clostridia bacterium]|nr:hypothetical protein [Clostridia bacterium]